MRSARRATCAPTYVNRRATDFVEDFITVDGGRTTVIAERPARRLRQHRLRQHRPGAARVSGRRLAGRVSVRRVAGRQRPVDRAARERRQLRRGGGEQPGDSVAHRRLSRDLRRRRAASRWAAWTTSSGTRSGCGRPTASTWHRFGRLDVAPLYRYNSPRTFSLMAAAVALTPAAERDQPGLRAAAVEPAGVLRRARFAGVRGLRAVRPRRDLRRAGVAVGPSLGEARGAEHVQQPAADLVGHHGGRRH